ncbi:MAG: hypothetical protein VW757_08245, partial [Halieaceae bacterium]
PPHQDFSTTREMTLILRQESMFILVNGDHSNVVSYTGVRRDDYCWYRHGFQRSSVGPLVARLSNRVIRLEHN